jgi:hypothetical protein
MILQEALITVDIYCRWEADPKAYRIYIYDELLTERTYHWRKTDQYVKENIVIAASPGTHQFRLESVDPKFRGFYWLNFTIDNQPISADNGQFILN